MRTSGVRRLLSLVLGTAAAWPLSSRAEDGVAPPWNPAAETLVLFNPHFPGSAELAAYYAQKRGLPASRVVGLPCPNRDDLSRAEFEALLWRPLQRLFEQNRWWPDPARPGPPVRVLALMRGVPFRVQRAMDPKEAGQEDETSVDSELTLLSLPQLALPGFVKNPYFESRERFDRLTSTPRLLLVGRLDGPDDATVRQMIDDALHAETQGLCGRSVIDLGLRDGHYAMGEDWLRESARSHRQAGIPVFADRQAEVIPAGFPLPDTILYFGWYRDHASGGIVDPGFRFARGAVACHLHSFSAAHLRDPGKYWLAPLLKSGAAAVLGNVWEPYLPLTCHLNLFNQRLLEGFTLAEAAWAATPVLSWMQVVVGDPLYRPFALAPNSRAHDPAGEEYVFYRGLLSRQSPEAEPAVLKKQLLRLAEEKQSPRLIELLALHCWNLGQAGEAAELFEHAAAIATQPAERARLERYRDQARP